MSKKLTKEEFKKSWECLLGMVRLRDLNDSPVFIRMTKDIEGHITALEGEVEKLLPETHKNPKEVIRYEQEVEEQRGWLDKAEVDANIQRTKEGELHALLKEKAKEIDFFRQNVKVLEETVVRWKDQSKEKNGEIERLEELTEDLPQEIRDFKLRAEVHQEVIRDLIFERDALKQKVEELEKKEPLVTEFTTGPHWRKLAEARGKTIENMREAAKPITEWMDKFIETAKSNGIDPSNKYPMVIRIGLARALKQACTEGEKE